MPGRRSNSNNPAKTMIMARNRSGATNMIWNVCAEDMTRRLVTAAPDTPVAQA
jgi:hypothetical protein